MKAPTTRLIVILIFLIGVVLILGAVLILLQVPACVATTATTSTMADRVATCVNTASTNAISSVQAFFNLSATLLIITLAIVLIRRLILLSQKPNLVIDLFVNATGNSDLDKALVGLNHLMRETLVTYLKQVRDDILKYSRRGELGKYHSPAKNPPPETGVDSHLTDLLTALQGSSFGPLQGVFQLIAPLFTPCGTKVSTILQGNGASPPTFGMSFEVTDLNGSQPPVLCSFWEEKLPLSSNEVVASPQVTGVSSTSLTRSSQPLASIYNTLGRVMLALVEQSKPPEENKDALANYTLGSIYQERGMLDKAQGQFENALTKQPDYAKAKEALQSVLKEVKAAEELYFSLMSGAADWLAIELIRRAYDEGGRRSFGRRYDDQRKEDVAHYRARIYNCIGALLQSAAGTHVHLPKFYDLALTEFKQAIDLDKGWYRPYKNLADTHMNKFQGIREKAEERDKRDKKDLKTEERDKKDLYEAISNYNKAAVCYCTQHFNKITGEKEKHSAATMIRLLFCRASWYFSSSSKKHSVATMIRLLGVDQATALVFDANGIEDTSFTLAKDIMNQVRGNGQTKGEPPAHIADSVWKLLEGIAIVDRKPWSENEEPDGQLLYGLAVWYGCAYNLAQKAPWIGAGDAERRDSFRCLARRYLVVCLVRDPGRTNDAKHDPNFIGIFETDEFACLQVAIAKKTCEVPDLQTKGLPLFAQPKRKPFGVVQRGGTIPPFDEDIENILSQINLEK